MIVYDRYYCGLLSGNRDAYLHARDGRRRLPEKKENSGSVIIPLETPDYARNYGNAAQRQTGERERERERNKFVISARV